MEENTELLNSLPAHGRISCARCFDGDVVWNKTERTTPDGWHIINNPLSWGSRTPKFLVLGVSKGTAQCEALNSKPHNEVPFAGFRPRLTDALRLLGLLRDDEAVDDKIGANEEDWAFGSVVRCALGLIDPADGSLSRSGTVVSRVATMSSETSWLTKCSSVFLARLPERLRVCVLLSNDERYIDACYGAIKRLRPATRRINSVAYGDSQTTWVHVVHVGGPWKNRPNEWFEGVGTQGRKRIEAQDAVFLALGLRPTASTATKKPADDQMTENVAARTRGRRPAATTGEGRALPENRVRDAIIARLRSRSDVLPHPDQAAISGTKYISAYTTSTGTSFAVDKMSASKQPVWFLDEARLRASLDDAKMDYEVYQPSRGRNSNLHKLPGFKNGALIRAYPSSVEDAMWIVDLLAGKG